MPGSSRKISTVVAETGCFGVGTAKRSPASESRILKIENANGAGLHKSRASALIGTTLYRSLRQCRRIQGTCSEIIISFSALRAANNGVPGAPGLGSEEP